MWFGNEFQNLKHIILTKDTNHLCLVSRPHDDIYLNSYIDILIICGCFKIVFFFKICTNKLYMHNLVQSTQLPQSTIIDHPLCDWCVHTLSLYCCFPQCCDNIATRNTHNVNHSEQSTSSLPKNILCAVQPTKGVWENANEPTDIQYAGLYVVHTTQTKKAYWNAVKSILRRWWSVSFVCVGFFGRDNMAIVAKILAHIEHVLVERKNICRRRKTNPPFIGIELKSNYVCAYYGYA